MLRKKEVNILVNNSTDKIERMKVAIYCRVSTTDQTVYHQINALTEYADKNDYEIFKIYEDVTSGKKQNRPALNQLMIDSRAKKFEVVIIWKLDRLGRSLKHLLMIVEEWKKKGIGIICTTQQIDTTSSSGELIFHILGAVAQFERELISERTKEGLVNAEGVGKRGKDKKRRKRSGYYLRYANKGGSVEKGVDSS